MNRTRPKGRILALAVVLLAAPHTVFPAASAYQSTKAAAPPAAGILKPEETAALLPSQVFFRGQSATVQIRNSGGIRYADGMLTLAALVDTSGYSSGIQQKYQAYLITETPLLLGPEGAEQKLAPGAYGVGFVAGDRFIVMDLGAHDLLSVASGRDAALRRPMPLQVLAAERPGSYRLYEGRAYVEIRPTP